MRETVRLLGEERQVRAPGVLDRASISMVLSSADVDWARAQLGLLGLCLVKGPRRGPAEHLAVYGERVWGWLQHLGAEDRDLQGVLKVCYELQDDILALDRMPTDQDVERARDFFGDSPTSSPGSGSPTDTPGTPCGG